MMYERYPLVICYIASENGPVEIVDLPSYEMVIFHSSVSLPEGISRDNSHYILRALTCVDDFPTVSQENHISKAHLHHCISPYS